MPLYSLSHWIQNLSFSTAIRESNLLYPILLTTHLACIALFGGAIVMTDLRLLGLAMRSSPVSDVIGQLRIWKRIGFAVMVTCGALLAAAEAEKYFANPYFWAKVTLLGLAGVHALAFRDSVYGSAAKLDSLPEMPARAKAAACLSLILWTGILCNGRMIAYYDTPDAVSQVRRASGGRL
jgi:hypothetical protein